MASTTFFNGNLLTTPTVASRILDDAMAPRGLSVGNVLAIVGRCTGGQPNTALAFGSPSEARRVLRSGELADAAVKAFSVSSATGAPGRVVAVRVGAAIAATGSLQTTGIPVVNLEATDYGLPGNIVRMKVESGTDFGKRLTTQRGNIYYTADNIGREVFDVIYRGNGGSATISVDGNNVVLAVNGGTVETIALAAYDTVGALTDRISAVPDFQATPALGREEHPTLEALDTVQAQDCKVGTYTVRADLTAIVEWINGTGEELVRATRVPGVGTVPTNTDWFYLTGGTDPAAIATDWANAFTSLQTEDVQHICVLNGSPAVHAMADAHVSFMSAATGKERRAYVGPPAGADKAAVKLLPRTLGSDRTVMCWPGHYDFDSSGRQVLRPSYFTALLIAAGFAGIDPGETMTNKPLKVSGLEYRPRNPTDTDELIQAGVCCVEDAPDGFLVVRAVSTWLTNNKFNRVEVSCGVATDYVARFVRNRLRILVGQGNGPITLSRAVSITETALRDLAKEKARGGPGVIVGDDDSPPYRNIAASAVGDVVAVEFECSPVVPTNFVTVSISVVPYTGTATA